MRWKNVINDEIENKKEVFKIIVDDGDSEVPIIVYKDIFINLLLGSKIICKHLIGGWI